MDVQKISNNVRMKKWMTMIDKCAKSKLPVKAWCSQNNISEQSYYYWLMRCGEKLEPLYVQMQEDIRKQSHVHMDETSVDVLEDKQATGRSKSYMWRLLK